MHTEDVLNAAFDYYKKYAGRVDYPVGRPVEDLQGVASDELSHCGTSDNLQLYTAWMAYYAALVHRWNFITGHIERRYKHLRAQRLARPAAGQKKYQQEAIIDRELEPYTEALELAQSKLSAAKANFNFSESQRDLVSRVITVTNSELKAIGRT